MKTILRILGYLKPYWRRVAVLYLALFIGLGLQLYIPSLIGRAIDQGILARDGAFIVRSALIIIGLALVQGLFAYLRSYLVIAVAERVGYDLRNQLYEQFQRLSFSFYDRSQTGQLMSRATDDVNNIRGMLMMSLRALVIAVVTLIAVTAIMLWYDWRLALVALSTMPLLVWWSVRFGITIRPLFGQVQQQFGVMTSALQENIAGARVVRAFAQEGRENARFEAELEELFARNLRAARRWSLSYPLMLLLSGLSTGAVLWFGGYRVLTGALSIGTLIAFNLYVWLMAEPVRWLGWVVNRIARAIASGDRIFEILDTKPAIVERPGAIELRPMRGEVRFDDVSFAYAGAGREALSNVSFTAQPGETIALLGPTGSGKSTIINLLPRFYDVTGGRILIDGHDVRDLTLKSLRDQIGAVLQESFLFSVSVRENIAYGRPDAAFEEVVAAARAAHAHDFIMALPEGYDTKLGERGVNLSGGQKQRVAIARALLMDPRILILDDATSSVDSETEYLIQQALHELMQGRTSFVIAQRLSTVKEADQILVLRDGRIVERGTHIELLQRDGFYREIYDLQLRDQEDVLRDALAGDD
ncbi:MAG: ABC transporter ATP-binding protein/permease [Chloroflexota bacterium]|nr:ABC transporter ATP-binding protein/permease [Chloroflexota bacterium]